jgi:hypothetical protein
MAADNSGAMKKTQEGQHEKAQSLEFNLTLLSQDTWSRLCGGSQFNGEQGRGGGVNEQVKRAFPVRTGKEHRKSEASSFLLCQGSTSYLEWPTALSDKLSFQT